MKNSNDSVDKKAATIIKEFYRTFPVFVDITNPYGKRILCLHGLILENGNDKWSHAF